MYCGFLHLALLEWLSTGQTAVVSASRPPPRPKSSEPLTLRRGRRAVGQVDDEFYPTPWVLQLSVTGG